MTEALNTSGNEINSTNADSYVVLKKSGTIRETRMIKDVQEVPICARSIRKAAFCISKQVLPS